MSELNDPSVIAEVTACHQEYEAALVGNDVAVLDRLFWQSDHAVRFGATESLYGAAEIAAFRLGRPAVDLARTVSAFTVVSFGRETAITTIEFDRPIAGIAMPGRQTQVWRRFDEGWKIVSAHVSYVWDRHGAMHAAAEFLSFSIAPGHRAGVQANLSRIREIAQPLLDFPLGEHVEAAPVFRP